MSKAEKHLTDEFAKAWVSFVFSKEEDASIHAKLLRIARKALRLARKEEQEKVETELLCIKHDWYSPKEQEKFEARVRGECDLPCNSCGYGKATVCDKCLEQEKDHVRLETLKDVESMRLSTAKEIKVWLIDNDLFCEEICDECKDTQKDYKKRFLSVKPQSDDEKVLNFGGFRMEKSKTQSDNKGVDEE